MSPTAIPGNLTLKNEMVDADPFFNNVSLLLHGDGANGSTTIVDSSPSPKTVTAVGDPQISTAQSKFGTASILFTGNNNDRLQVASDPSFAFGADAFTIELWLFPTALNTTQIILDGRFGDGSGLVPNIGLSGSTLYYYTNNNVRITGSSLSVNQWYHVALARLGTNTKLFVNGAQVGNTYVDTINYAQCPVLIGNYFGDGYPVYGYIDDLRITKGIARYTSNFTPPTAPFPEVLG